MDEDTIREIARQEALAVYRDEGTRFGVASVPRHIHDNVDTPNIPGTSIQEVQVLPAADSGMLSPAKLGTQVPVQGISTRSYAVQEVVPQPQFTVFPTVIVYGNGSGSAGSFNGGDAPVGSLVFFANGTSKSGLWLRAKEGWYGVAQASSGYGNTFISDPI